VGRASFARSGPRSGWPGPWRASGSWQSTSRQGGGGCSSRGAPSPEFDWTAPRPALAAAFGSLEAVIEDLGRDVLAEAVAGLADRDRAAGKLALLVAFAPYQIDEGVIAGFRDIQPSDAEILAAVSWASFTATRRISGWLSPAA
jgi:hypothetical protein